MSRPTLNPLIPRCFDVYSHKKLILVRRSRNRQFRDQNILLANFSFRSSLYTRGRTVVRSQKECQMAWKTPKIVELPVGMEINMYACAARK